MSESLERCGCGLPAKYTLGNEVRGSCNKYSRCPTYAELKAALAVTQERLPIYQTAINEIDDYFEYRSESKKDQKIVYKILGNLTDKVTRT